MSGFSPDWLALREPLDAACRATELTWAFGRALPVKPSLIDLGAGTGANFRFLVPRLGRIGQDWTLVEHDPDLIERTPSAIAGWAGTRGIRMSGEGAGFRLTGDMASIGVEIRAVDLSGPLDGLGLAARDGVTASALFDLVSQAWLDRFAAALVAAGLPPVLATLTVDGRVDLLPGDPDDDAVLGRFHLHMRRDKGFGPALGPMAPQALHVALEAAGYRVWSARSDWTVGPDHARAQIMLLEGYAEAARTVDPPLAGTVEAWMRRRRDLASAGRLTIRVGHADIVALR